MAGGKSLFDVQPVAAKLGCSQLLQKELDTIMSRIYIKLVFILILMFSAGYTMREAKGDNGITIPASAYIADTEDDRNMQSVTDTVRALPPAKQKELFAQYLAHNYPVNLPDFWKLVTEPDKGLMLLAPFAEPYNPDILDMLERVLPNASQEVGIRIAAILYRYHRPSGNIYLSKILNENADKTAALIFAVNKDTNQLPQILKVLSTSQDIDYEVELVKVLSSWHDPRIAPVLYSIFQRKPKNSYLALALADQNYQNAIPLIRKLYFLEPQNSFAKVDAGVALIKFDGKQADPILHFLTTGLAEPHGGIDTSMMQDVTFEDFGILKIAAATPALKAAIENYLSPKPSLIHPVTTQLAKPIELAVKAADALAKIDDKSSTQLVARLLRHYMKTQTQEDLLFRVADSLLQLDTTHIDAGKLMGKKWVERKLLIEKLEPLPEYLIPHRVGS